MLGAGQRLLWHGFLLLLVTSLLWMSLFLSFSIDQRNQQQQRQRRPLALSHRPTYLGTHKKHTSQSHLAQNARLMLGAHGKGNISEDKHGQSNRRNTSALNSAKETNSPNSRYSFHTPAFSSVNKNRRTQENSEISDISSSAISIASAVKLLPPERYLVKNASFFVLRKEVVNRFKGGWRIQSSCPADGPFLLVIVPSVSGHTAQRKAIRKTWASQAYASVEAAGSGQLNTTVKVIFFVGRTSSLNRSEALSEEARQFQDIVVGDFVDTYRNLSLKMALVLRWVHERCAQASYVIKVDEDTFVHLPLLLKVLRSLPARFSDNFVLGRSRSVQVLPAVARDGRWAVSKRAYPLPYWPQYLYGHSYVISRQAMQSLHHASRHMPLIVNEDAYVTGVLAKSGAVQRLHSDHFAVLNNDDRCLLVSGKAVSQTGFPYTTLYSAWKAVQSGNCSLVYQPVVIVVNSPTD